MGRALLILTSDATRSKAMAWVRSAPNGTRVEFKETKRSIPQNDLMWSLLSQIAQQVVWYGQKLSSDDWKDMFTASLKKARVVPGIDGGSFVPLGMRTSDMSKDEMSALIELIYAFGAEHGAVFREQPYP
jgi:hypothetical protein